MSIRVTELWTDIYLLHQPSYSALHHKDRSTADPSNGYIAMLMGNVVKENETILIDDLHRRSGEPIGWVWYLKGGDRMP